MCSDNTSVTSDVTRLNRTSSEAPPAGAAYSVFADLDGNGRIQISDVNTVKARINDVLPAALAFSEVRVMAAAPARDIAARPPRRGLLDGDPAGLLA